MDHLTCGQCLREFPLYMITTFIQHKKLDCGDEIVMETTSPELLCGYCPMGFMTAWGLLMHAQITHNLRIFLEKSSASTRSSLPQTQPPTLPDHTTVDVPSTAESSVMSDTAGGTVMARSMDRSNGETVFDMSGQGKTQSSIVTGKLTVSSGKGRELRFVREDAINQGISNVYVPNADTSVTIVTNGTCNVNTSPTVLRDVLGKDNSSSLGKVSTSATVPSRRYLSVIAPVRESVTMTEDGTIDVSSSSKPSTHLPQLVSPPKTTLGDLWHASSSSSLKPPVMDVEQANKVEPAQQGGATETTTTEYLSMPTLDALVGSATFNSGQDSTMEDRVIEETANEPQSMDAIQPNEITTMGSITSSLVSTEPHLQGDDSSSGTGPAGTVMETEEVTRQEGCCENQGCGVTVIPGSHQQLQDCCNAVLPKKRKRHMEMKHMPFSFSSSRYGRRKTFSSMKQCSSGVCRFAKNSGSTIYIDVGPDTFVPETSTVEVTSSKPPTANVTVSTSQQPPASAKSAPVKRLLIPPQSRPRSLILKPGAVFAIPFSCTMPTSSNTASAPLIIPTASSQEGAVAQVISGSEQTESLSTLPTDTGNNTTPTHPAMTTSVPSNPDGDRMDHGYSALYSAGRQFQCGDCSLSFNQRIHLKKHTSKHTGIKPYKCGQCDYSTVERSHLKVHIRIHTGEKPFKCTYCEYATAQNSTLKIHLKRHHGGRMFRCGGCEKTFTQERQLNNHEWEHNPGVALVVRHETISSKNEASTSITTPQPSHHAEATVIPVDNLTPELAGQGTSHGTSNQTTDGGHGTSPPRDCSV